MRMTRNTMTARTGTAKDIAVHHGRTPIQVPQDRSSDFKPQVVPKYKKDQRDRREDYCDVCTRDERSADFETNQEHLQVRS